ncbi:hypothetical protein MMC18_007724 [Xylographa bjoerkii]|nr:hypothetical protein [Xylographa bjoerkii]
MTDLSQTIATLHELYRLFIAIGYFGTDSVSWPPHTSKPLNTDLCRSVGRSESAVAFILAIPWVQTGSQMVCESVFIDFADDDQLQHLKDPLNYYVIEPDEPRNLEGWMVPLTFPDEGGTVLLVDTREDTIRDWNGNSPLRADLLPRPDDSEHWANFPARPAAEFLRGLIDRYTSLVGIPFEARIEEDVGVFLRSLWLPRIKAALLQYGWPDRFRKEEFFAALPEMERRWWDEDHLAEGVGRL